MLKYAVLFCLAAVVYSNKPSGSLPHGHNLAQMVDGGFRHIDSNSDGSVTLVEFDGLVKMDTTNNATCVSIDNFKASNPEFVYAIADAIFSDMERNHDNCVDINEIRMEFFKIDHDGSGVLSLHEYEHYYTNIMHHLNGHGHNVGK